MMALEMENERMQRELMLLQEQNMLARNRRKDDREGRSTYLWSRLRSFVRQPSVSTRYLSMLNNSDDDDAFRSMTSFSSRRPHTSLGLYGLGASFPFGSIYGYSSLSPLYHDYDDDYYPISRISTYRSPLRTMMRFSKKTTTTVEEEEPEKPKIILPFSVYPRIWKKPKQRGMVENVVSGFQPGERVMKVYSSQEVDDAGPVIPQAIHSFRSTDGRVNTIYTQHTPRDGNTTSRSYSVNGRPFWSSAGPVLSGSQHFTYQSPHNGFTKTFAYTPNYRYQNLLPLTTGRSSYSSGALTSSLPSESRYTKVYQLPRSRSDFQTTLSTSRYRDSSPLSTSRYLDSNPLLTSRYLDSKSLSTSHNIDRYPLSTIHNIDRYPLSSHNIDRYRLSSSGYMESYPLSNRYISQSWSHTPSSVGNPTLVYRGEHIPLDKPNTYSTVYQNANSSVRVIPVDRDSKTNSDENKENKPKGKRFNFSFRKNDKSKEEEKKKDAKSGDPFQTNPQLAARFYAAGTALQAISRFSNRSADGQTGSTPASGRPVFQPPVIPRTTADQASDPMATDPNLAGRLQSAAVSLHQLREKYARQQAEVAAEAEEAERKAEEKEKAKQQHNEMMKKMTDAHIESNQRTVRFMTDMSQQEQDYLDERAKSRAKSRAESHASWAAFYESNPTYYRGRDSFQPPSKSYKPPPEEGKEKSKSKSKTDKGDKTEKKPTKKK